MLFLVSHVILLFISCSIFLFHLSPITPFLSQSIYIFVYFSVSAKYIIPHIPPSESFSHTYFAAPFVVFGSPRCPCCAYCESSVHSDPLLRNGMFRLHRVKCHRTMAQSLPSCMQDPRVFLVKLLVWPRRLVWHSTSHQLIKCVLMYLSMMYVLTTIGYTLTNKKAYRLRELFIVWALNHYFSTFM